MAKADKTNDAAEQKKNTSPEGKIIKKILKEHFPGVDKKTKDGLIAEISKIAEDYFKNDKSEENVALKDYYILTVIDNPEIGDILKQNDLDKESFFDKGFYEALHLIYEKQTEYSKILLVLKEEEKVLKRTNNSKTAQELNEKTEEIKALEEKIKNLKAVRKKISEKTDTLVIEAKTYATGNLFKKMFDSLNNSPEILSTDLVNSKNLEEFLYIAKATMYSNKLVMLGINNNFSNAVVNISKSITDAYSLPEEVITAIRNDPQKALIYTRFFGELAEYKYEKAYIDATIRALVEKYPELQDGENKKNIVAFRSGVIETGNSKGQVKAKNKYQAYTEEEHIGLGGNGTNAGIETAFLSITESPIVLPVYDLSNRDTQNVPVVPILIDIRKIYEMLLERKKELDGNMLFDGEKEFLELLVQLDLGIDNNIKQEKVAARLKEIAALGDKEYKRRTDLPEGFFDREKLTKPKKAGKDAHTFAFASAELLFKSNIPAEATREMNSFLDDILVASVGTDIYDKLIEQIIQNDDKENPLAQEILRLTVGKNAIDCGLNAVELDFIQRFYVNREPTSEYIYVPEITEEQAEKAQQYIELKESASRGWRKVSLSKFEKDEMIRIENELLEAGLSQTDIDALGHGAERKKLDEIRREQVELGIRTSIVKKLFGTPEFLKKIGIDLEELKLDPEKLQRCMGNLVQASISGPESKHLRYRQYLLNEKIEAFVTEDPEYFIKTTSNSSSYTRPATKGITAQDELVAITGKEYSTNNGSKVQRNVKPTPKAMELDGDEGEIQYAMHSVVDGCSVYVSYIEPDVRFSRVSYSGAIKKIPFKVEHCAKNAAKELGKTVTYYIADKTVKKDGEER